MEANRLVDAILQLRKAEKSIKDADSALDATAVLNAIDDYKQRAKQRITALEQQHAKDKWGV